MYAHKTQGTYLHMNKKQNKKQKRGEKKLTIGRKGDYDSDLLGSDFRFHGLKFPGTQCHFVSPASVTVCLALVGILGLPVCGLAGSTVPGYAFPAQHVQPFWKSHNILTGL